MRTGFAIFFLLLLCFPFWGTYGILLHRRSCARRSIALQIAEGAGQSNLTKLSFSKADSRSLLDWEHGHEFEYLGEMYDVVRSEAIGDSIVYYCIPDKVETVLNNQLRQATNNNPQNKQDFKSLMDFFKSIYCPPLPDIYRHVAAMVKQQDHYFMAYLSHSFPPPVPPPKA
ncbi:MAG: hypothetical protein H6577_06840 [Lewinellaceae bacterium]|nr:hypothetical protein [Saprospiraceae bacterium]MCB9337826.1 hypothetical protein [Lewinellaceae bacterium]